MHNYGGQGRPLRAGYKLKGLIMYYDDQEKKAMEMCECMFFLLPILIIIAIIVSVVKAIL